MKIELVRKLTSLERLLYWIVERHQIHLRRQAGEPKPWTDDEILQNYFFTNPYRENDKTTVWFRNNIRDPLKDSDDVLMATVIFRWFNLIRTGDMLKGSQPVNSPLKVRSDLRLPKSLLCQWDKNVAIQHLTRLWDGGKNPVFTGAYMIKAGNGEPGCKIPSVCEAITNVWNQRQRLISVAKEKQTLQALWKELTCFKHLGGFMAYEIVCDLRYTKLLEHATDINTWANPGPGALRGLLRLEGGTLPLNTKGGPKRAVTVKDPLKKMIALLEVCRKQLPKDMPEFDLRCVEHSCCEYSKYEAGRLGDMKMKRNFNGKGDPKS